MNVSSLVTTPPDFLKLLAHDLRWQLLRELVHSDYRVQELVERVNRPMNLVSYHLKQLRNHSLVTERRSSADGRDVYYSLDLGYLTTLYHESGSQLHPALGKRNTEEQDIATNKSQPSLRVLFLCTHNSARSQMAEGLLRQLGGAAVEVFSAGNQPGTVHPQAIRAMAELGIDISDQRSKHMEEFYGQSFDLVVTVCDRVREECPVFPHDPERVHWSIPDPLDPAAGDSYALFAKVAQELRSRVTYLLLTMRHRSAETSQPEQTTDSKPIAQPKPAAKAKVLFLCTGNSARSQMGEALLTKYAGDRYEVQSAGLAPKAEINPYTVRVMQELGIDLSDKRCTDVSEYLGRSNYAYLFTVCARTEKDCPSTFLNFGGERIDWYFEDPVRFAGNEEATLAKFREVRDQIDQRIRQWLAARGEWTE